LLIRKQKSRIFLIDISLCAPIMLINILGNKPFILNDQIDTRLALLSNIREVQSSKISKGSKCVVTWFHAVLTANLQDIT
jgi:hypothetical protein